MSGQSYEDYLRDHLFRPAAMIHSGLNATPIGASLLAIPNVKTVAGYGPPAPPFLGAATPAGGAYASVGDLLAFATALTSHRLLDAAHTDLLLSPHVHGDYAYGFEVHGAAGFRDVGHDGGGPGENGGFRVLDDGAAVVLVLSKLLPPSAPTTSALSSQHGCVQASPCMEDAGGIVPAHPPDVGRSPIVFHLNGAPGGLACLKDLTFQSRDPFAASVDCALRALPGSVTAHPGSDAFRRAYKSRHIKPAVAARISVN